MPILLLVASLFFSNVQAQYFGPGDISIAWFVTAEQPYIGNPTDGYGSTPLDRAWITIYWNQTPSGNFSQILPSQVWDRVANVTQNPIVTGHWNPTYFGGTAFADIDSRGKMDWYMYVEVKNSAGHHLCYWPTANTTPDPDHPDALVVSANTPSGYAIRLEGAACGPTSGWGRPQAKPRIVNPEDTVTVTVNATYSKIKFNCTDSMGALFNETGEIIPTGELINYTLTIPSEATLGRWTICLWAEIAYVWKLVATTYFNVVVMKTYADAACTIEQTTFNPGETIWVKAEGLPNGTYRLKWLDPSNNPVYTSSNITVKTANNNGSANDSWSGALTLGQWNIRLEKLGPDGWDRVGGWSTVKITTFRVIPEVPIGVIISTLSMLGALVGFVLIRKPKI
jgi:hypothetical protein